ncbi:uncharacterized protein LOC123565087 [Mercenaria mercenaria]|uniref:uncharacterized protein LOC123565087 n=1 Tax=Mercenaria mercenaria TaxID=6596 RepID=UPI00234EDB6C|nr:uncharacterized protein LOC123565087 [Mercenaria mercenaria]
MNLGLSPGSHTIKYADKCLKRRLQKQQRQQLPSVKRRRLVLKQERSINQGALEALEGVSYQSEVSHSSSVDIEKLPDAVPRGNFKPVKVESGQPTIIAIDLETTDLIRGSVMPHITQLAAVEVKSGAQFAVYTKPKMAVTSEAQRVTGICVDDNGDIVVNGNLVESIHIQSAIEKLCRWLDQFSNVFLIAHNGRRFDFPILMTAVQKTKTTDVFFKSVFGFVDSLSVFRKKYPGESLKQEHLARQHLGMTYNAHNAEADVEALGHLLKLCEVSDLLNFSFSPVAVKNSLLFNCEKSKNLRSFDPLISKGICKRPTAENIAGSGLNVEHLKVYIRRSGEDGLRDTFTAVNCDGLPRVTNSKKVLEETVPKFCQYFYQMYLHRHRYLYE